MISIRNLHRALWVTGVTLALFTVMTVSVSAQSIVVTVSEPSCSAEMLCETRLSYSGRIYSFQQETYYLYIQNADRSGYARYDLSAYNEFPPPLNGFVDLVFFEDAELVAFYSVDGYLHLYSLATGQLETINVGIYPARLIACNRYSPLLYLTPNYIVRLGGTNQLAICEVNDQRHLLIHLFDVVSTSIIQTIDFGRAARGVGDRDVPWPSLVGGLDGRLYIMTASEAPPELLAGYSENRAENTFTIFGLTPLSTTWTAQTVLPQQIWNDPRFISLPRYPLNAFQFVSVDTAGNYYFYSGWTEHEQNLQFRTEVARVSPSGDETVWITDRDLGRRGVFSGLSITGEMLLQSGPTPQEWVLMGN
ncbi:MAG: hypothetical protein U0670_07330 [Anaerolineae bacterium]